MASSLMVLTAATMYLGDLDPNASLHLSLKSFTVPALKAKTKDHMAGGAMVGLNVSMGVLEPFSFPFSLEGINTEAMAQFLNPAGPQNYTVRGNIRDINTQQNKPVVAVIRGIMVESSLGEYSRDGGTDSSFNIDEVLAYRLHIDGKEVHYVDWAQGPAGIRINGVAIFNDVARNLGLI